MRKSIVFLAAALAATPVFADKKLDDAVAKAESLVDKGKPDDALKTIQKAAEGANTSEAYLALARFQNRLASPDDAQASVAKAVELSRSAPPDAQAEALAALSSMDLMRGTGRDAIQHAEEAAKAAPASASALAALARAQARTKLATALIAEGNAAAAEDEAKKATEADPKSGEAFAVYGRAILARDPKRWDEAIAQAQQGAFLNPKDPLVQMAVGQIFEAGNNIDQANLAYGRALATDPGFTAARVANASVLIRKGQTDAALSDLQKIVQEMPGNAQAQLQLGRIYLRKGDWQNAYNALDQAVKLSPGDAEAQARL